MKIYSSTAVVASTLLTLATNVAGQTSSNQTQQTRKFYVTTPQTGQRVSTGGPSQRPLSEARSVASANSRPQINVSHASTTTQIPQQAASTAEVINTSRASGRQISSVPASAASSHGDYRIQQVSNAPTSDWKLSRTNPTGRTPAAASAANFYSTSIPQRPQGQVQTNASVGHSHGTATTAAPAQKRSLMNRILHPGHTHEAKAPATASAPALKPSKMNGHKQAGEASWYGPKWHGRKTASGEKFDMNSMTAAHRSLPFGTLVKVTNERNGRECVVRINNRGPFTKGRILDVSKGAASVLGMVNSGVAKVRCEVIGRT